MTLPRRAYLGAELFGDLEAFTAEGLRIAGVLDDGMAAAARITAGDVVVEIAGLPVRNRCDLAAALRAAGGSETAELVYTRDGVMHACTVAVVGQRRDHRGEYGELVRADGVRLRTIRTCAGEPRAAILVIPGIACESVDLPLSSDAPLAGLVDAWVSAGIDVVRFDKRGIGDSEGGPCPATDFETELADARAALALAAEHARVRNIPLVMFGHSVGGIIASILAAETPVAGVMVLGTPVTRWLDCLLDSTRRQLALRDAPPDEIDRALAAITELAERGELNGRSAAYHAQLHAFDLAAPWRAIAAPVVVLRGEHDWVVRAADQSEIARLARAELVELPGLDHLGGWHADREASLRDYGDGLFDPVLATATLAWLARTLSS